MKLKTSELTGAALDWAVAKCLHGNLFMEPYSTDWAQGGPIIEREGIALDVFRSSGVMGEWVAVLIHEDKEFDGFARAEFSGPTPLIAAMRCYVASKLSEEVEIPEELQ